MNYYSTIHTLELIYFHSKHKKQLTSDFSNFPPLHWRNPAKDKVSFLFSLFTAVKADSKLTLHHMGKFFIIQLTKTKFKIWRVMFLKSILPQRNYGMDFRFSWLSAQCNAMNCRWMIWAMSWENLFMPYVNNKGADQPAHPRSLISTFVVRCLDSIISLVSIFAISWL